MAKNHQELFTISKDALITTDTDIYQVELLDETLPYDELDKAKAYVYGDYYYLLRGRKPDDLDNTNRDKLCKPGIYKDGKGRQFLYHPATEQEIEKYNYLDSLVKYDPEHIVNILKQDNELYLNNVDPGKIFKVTVGDNDNILHRAMKEVFRRKNVDLRQCIDRFPNKHALTNFKQTMTSPDKKNLTILLFERGADALNLKYTLIIEDKDGDVCVGDRLMEPVVVCSEDLLPISSRVDD